MRFYELVKTPKASRNRAQGCGANGALPWEQAPHSHRLPGTGCAKRGTNHIAGIPHQMPPTIAQPHSGLSDLLLIANPG